MLKVASMFTVKEDHNLVSQEVSEESSEIEGLLDVFINTHKSISFCLNFKVLCNYKLCF